MDVIVSIDPTTAREFLEGVIAGFAVLGGIMAYFSGYEASKALAEDQPLTPSRNASMKDLASDSISVQGLRSWLL